MGKIDFKKELKHLYLPSSKQFELVDVPLMNFLMIDGHGDPNTVTEYQEAIEALYAVAYKLKFISKKEPGKDFVVPPLEGLWWAQDMSVFIGGNKDHWDWTMMIMQPGWITIDMFEEACKHVEKSKNPSALKKLRLESYQEGLSLQIMHIGSYDDEAPTLARLHNEFIPQNGYIEAGKHHEIYLGDPRKVPSEKLRTVLRQPVKKNGREARMRIAITIFLIILVVVIITGIYFWYAMQKPLYEPGMVRDGKNLRAPLMPPKQPAVMDFWIVEDDIQLYHFSKGAGKNVLIIHGGPGFPFSEPWPGLDTLAGDYQFHYYDQRGCGKSSRPVDKFNSSNYYKNMKSLDKILGLGAQVADIERIRRILGDDKLIIIGHSFGAFLASLYAAEFPEHVEAMVMVTPAPMFVLPMEVEGLFDIIQKRLPDNMQEDYNKWYKNYFDFKNIFSKAEADLVALNKELTGFFLSSHSNFNAGSGRTRWVDGPCNVFEYGKTP